MADVTPEALVGPGEGHVPGAAPSQGQPRGGSGLVAGRRRHQVHVDHFEPEAGDPVHEPGEGSLIGQFGAKRRRAPAEGDLTVVKLRA